MKHTLTLTLTVLFIVMLLPTIMIRTADTPQPESTPTVSADNEIRFTVLSGDTVETVTMADYLPGVLAGEMPALFESEALKAQAVAARTYILHRIAHQSTAHPEAVICNNPACCKAYCSDEQLHTNWGDNYDAFYEKVKNAVHETDGLYLTYEDQPIEAVFHASSAGATESSGSIWNDRAYLVSVESPETEEDVPKFVSTVTFTAQQMQDILAKSYPNMDFSADPGQWFSQIERNESGRVQSATICGQNLTGPQIRSVLNLRSTAFTVSYNDRQFTFSVTGHGHGVGMSQYGANVYAKQGWKYADILAHYYPNTQLTSAG